MSRFSDPKSFFDSMYVDTAPWDIGRPQPALTELFDTFPPEGPVLELGCGTGDVALELAHRGLEVLGVDLAAAAIDQAREKAAAAPSEIGCRVTFEVADALRPSRLGRRFGAVVDCGFFHLFEDGQRAELVSELVSVIEPRGRLYLLAFAMEFPLPNTPRQVQAQEVRERFSLERGWNVLEVRDAQFLSRIAPVVAVAACIERQSER